ncbi:MAG: MATE family efflux transporter [Lachnospiraceae bacterium]|jgi:putative MATE family efflux protein|nr:MATE family efflux transporter [Lachnospiraceae bacterium]
MEKNLTTGSVFKTVLQFSLPYLLSYFLQTLYGMADLFIIGQFNGVDSTTAVSIGSQVMHMLTVMIVGLAMGSTVMIGRAVGSRKPDQAAQTIGNTITLFMLLSVFLMGGLLLAVNAITAVMSTPAEAVSGTVSYLTICFIGIPFITAYNIISSIFRGMGDSKSPMYFIAVSCVVNIALDYLFIGSLGLGAAGAALGTTLSQTISVLLALFVIRRQRMGIKLSTKDLKPHRQTMSGLLKIGVPISLQDGFIQISFIVITIIANKRGLNDAAAVGIVEKLIGFIFLVPSTMLSTVSALAAQNIGARRHDRARRTLRYAILIAASWGFLAVLVMQIAAEPFVSLFVDQAKAGSNEVVRLGGQYMRGYVWDCIFAGIHFCFSGYFCAYGLSMIPFFHNSISIVCARIPLAYLTSTHFADTLFPMGLASTTGSLLSVLICVGVFLWLKKHQVKTDPLQSAH